MLEYIKTLVLNIIVASLSLPISFATESKRKETNGDDGKCELVGTFSLLTQALLGLLCLSSLIVKRYYEYPLRRTWPVWLFDVLKQVIGAFGVHVFNIFLSIVKTRKDDSYSVIRGYNGLDNSDDNSEGDPCDWYFLNIVFDCTIGVYILYLVFKAANQICKKMFHMTQIESGIYGDDPRKPSYRAFFKQLAVYFLCLMVTKLIIYGLVECFESQLLWFTSHFLLVWLDEYPDEFEIFIVMFVVPVLMNCLQLVLIDNFIQNQVLAKANERVHFDYDTSPSQSNAAREVRGLLNRSIPKKNVNGTKKLYNEEDSLCTYGTIDNV
ncbi:uncharacterized protein PRCAT00004962001 [Priceomyces carsonii]|uniref:uncharacterized protein n=1 Tax=Priceomyces carsonii TaxID=28549 RepID=UPI002ED84296|nr:unnamed protein product [Priceomyces carsonii]